MELQDIVFIFVVVPLVYLLFRNYSEKDGDFGDF